ncbi:MAG: ABC transporter ATP-binding protein, partial [Spirochaetota bacterium]
MSVELRHIVKGFPEFTVELSVKAAQGELLTLLGPSGCGKTTTLHLIAGFLVPDRGRVFIGGSDVTGLPPHARGVGIVFQDYALFPHLDVFGNIAFGLRMQGWRGRDARKRVEELLELVRLPGYAGRRIPGLSGGEQQRVALARALAPNPRLLLLDEPLSALDAKLRGELRGEIRRIQRELDVTTIYVTHDQEEALALSDSIAVMQRGKIEQTGSPRQVYDRPLTLFTARFMGVQNLLPGRVVGMTGGDGVAGGGTGGGTPGGVSSPAGGNSSPAGMARVATPEGLFEGRAARRFAEGEEVTVLFRAERCRLADRREELNCVSGTAGGSEYLGEAVTVTVRAGSGSFTARCDPAGRQQCRAGDRVFL